MGFLQPFGSFVKGTHRNNRSTGILVPLCIGYTISATTVFAMVALAGAAIRSASGTWTPALPALLAVLAFADFGAPGLSCPMVRRQTPKMLPGLFPRSIGGLLWGLDTGSVFSTFRATSASWAVLLLVAGGWAPAWAGAIYAAGFSIPLATILLIRKTSPAGQIKGHRGVLARARLFESTEVAGFLLERTRLVRLVSAAAITATAVVAAMEMT